MIVIELLNSTSFTIKPVCVEFIASTYVQWISVLLLKCLCDISDNLMNFAWILLKSCRVRVHVHSFKNLSELGSSLYLRSNESGSLSVVFSNIVLSDCICQGIIYQTLNCLMVANYGVRYHKIVIIISPLWTLSVQKNTPLNDLMILQMVLRIYFAYSSLTLKKPSIRM